MKWMTGLLSLVVLFGCGSKKEIDLAQFEKLTTEQLCVYTDADTTLRDARLQNIRKGRDMDYDMPEYKTLSDWQERANYLKRHIFITTGLWPLPDRTPLEAQVYDKIEHPDYTIEKVYFQSYPGFFVTGNLYRPRGDKSVFPAIVTPHGHWKGRLENSDENSIPGRCINFAKQGYVVFSYDMVGYQDSKQVSHKFADTDMHRLWGISLMGLQLWNSLRAVDFISSLPDVDITRIGCTGASGGGTQTFMLTAVDNRIQVAAPVNMLSAHFQGGCLCENVSGLRLNTFNIEIGALAAPRPLLMVSTTQDWTKNTPTVEYPMMRSIYKLYDAEDKVKYVQYDYPHNYNKDSREAVYAWFGKWLLDDDNADHFKEQPFQVDAGKDLLNFPGETQPPGDMNEENMTGFLKQRSKDAFETMKKDKGKFSGIYGTAFKHIIAADENLSCDVKVLGESAGESFLLTRLLISEKDKNNWIPAFLFEPQTGNNNITIYVNPDGKNKALDGTNPVAAVKERLDAGESVLAIDVFRVGEHVLTDGMTGRDESIKHFYTFNRSDVQERIQDILAAVTFAKDYKQVTLLGEKQAAAWCLLAADVCDRKVKSAGTVNLAEMNTEDYLLQNVFIPGLARFGGLEAAQMLYDMKK